MQTSLRRACGQTGDPHAGIALMCVLTSCSACLMRPPLLSMARRCGLLAYESAMCDSARHALSTTLASCKVGQDITQQLHQQKRGWDTWSICACT